MPFLYGADPHSGTAGLSQAENHKSYKRHGPYEFGMDVLVFQYDTTFKIQMNLGPGSVASTLLDDSGVEKER